MKMGSKINSGLYSGTKGDLRPPHLMDELKNSGFKYTEKDVVMVTKNSENKLMWLEKGDKYKGLQHFEKHRTELEKHSGENITSLPAFVKKVIAGEIFSNGRNRKGPYTVYRMNNKNYKVAYGDNGFIVSIFPQS